MATAKTDSELLDFVQKKYEKLKPEAEKDNSLPQAEVTHVIALIATLFETIKKVDVTHEEIVKQLNELKPLYSGLNLDAADYPRYADADKNLNMIVEGFKEEGAGAAAGEKGAGEKGSGAGETGAGETGAGAGAGAGEE